MTPSAPKAAIARITRQGGPDNCLNIVGDMFGVDTSFWTFGQNTALNASLLECSSSNGLLLRRNGNLATIALPQSQIAKSMHLVWPKNSGGYGKPLCVNRTEAVWLQCSETAIASAIQVTTYNAGTSYNANDRVLRFGFQYECIKVPNSNNPPELSPMFWRVVSVLTAAWNSNYTYKKYIRVSIGGLNYESLADLNMNNNPTAPGSTWWRLLPVSDVVSVYGENLMHLGSTPGQLRCGVWIEPQAGGAGQWVTPTSVNPYRVDFQLPVDIALGTWNVWLHNGHGDKYGWSGPLTLTVATATTLGINYAAHTAAMPAPTGGDDFANFNITLGGLTAPGTLTLVAGATYQLSAPPNAMNGILLQGGGPQGTGAPTTIKTTAAFNGGNMLNFHSKGAMDNVIINTDAGGTFDSILDHAIVSKPWRVTNCTFNTWQQVNGLVLNRPLDQAFLNGQIFRNNTVTGMEIGVSGGQYYIIDGNTFYQTGSTESPLGQLLSTPFVTVVNNISTDLDVTQGWETNQPSMLSATSGGAGGTLTGTWFYTVIGYNRFGQSRPANAPNGTDFLEKSFTQIPGSPVKVVLNWDLGSADYDGYIIYKSRTSVAGMGAVSYTSPALVATLGAMFTFTDTTDSVSAGTFQTKQDGNNGTMPNAYKRGQGRIMFSLSGAADCYFSCNLTVDLAQASPNRDKGEQMMFGEFALWFCDSLVVASSPISISVDAGDYAAFQYSNTVGSVNDLASSDANTSSPHVTSASRPFTLADVGSPLLLSSGVNFITSLRHKIVGFRASDSSAILDQACGTIPSSGAPPPPPWAGGVFSATPWTDLTSNDANTSAPHVTSATKPFTSDSKGRVLRISGGANYLAQTFSIVDFRASDSSAVLDRACGTGVGPWSGGRYQEIVLNGTILFVGNGKAAQDYRAVVNFTGGTYSDGYPALNGTVNSVNIIIDKPWIVQPDTTSQITVSNAINKIIAFSNGQSGNTQTADSYATGLVFNCGTVDCVIDSNSYTLMYNGLSLFPSVPPNSWQQMSHVLIQNNSFTSMLAPVYIDCGGTAALHVCCCIARNNTHVNTITGTLFSFGQQGQYTWDSNDGSDINVIEHVTASHGLNQPRPGTSEEAVGVEVLSPTPGGSLILYKNSFSLGVGLSAGSIGLDFGTANIIQIPPAFQQFHGYASNSS